MSVSDPAVRITRLANGLTVASEAISGVQTTHVGIWVAAGSRNERLAEHGLSHLLEHMAFKGTARRSARQIAEDIENVGGEINAATSAEHTAYTARVLPEDLGLAVDVLGDILTGSAFDPVELAREVNVILQEHAAVEDAPDDLVGDAFMEKAFAGQALGRPILGRPETVRGFGPEDLRGFVAREYLPGRMVLAGAGRIEHDRLADLAEGAFGALAPAAPPDLEPAAYTGGEARLRRRLEQANVILGLPGLSFRDARYFALHLFTQALGGGLTSRLWHEVRETRGLAYAVDAFHWPFTDCGVFGIGAATAPADLAELIDLALSLTRDAAATLSFDELERAKAQLKVALLGALESPAGRIERAARQILAWGRVIPPEETVAHVDAVTVEAARAAGASLLEGPPTLAAVGPIRSLPSLKAVTARLVSP